MVWGHNFQWHLVDVGTTPAFKQISSLVRAPHISQFVELHVLGFLDTKVSVLFLGRAFCPAACYGWTFICYKLKKERECLLRVSSALLGLLPNKFTRALQKGSANGGAVAPINMELRGSWKIILREGSMRRGGGVICGVVPSTLQAVLALVPRVAPAAQNGSCRPVLSRKLSLPEVLDFELFGKTMLGGKFNLWTFLWPTYLAICQLRWDLWISFIPV